MISLNTKLTKIFIVKYYKVIVHLRQEINRGRFQLVFNSDLDNKNIAKNWEQSLIWKVSKDESQEYDVINDSAKTKKSLWELLIQNTCLLVGFSIKKRDFMLQIKHLSIDHPGTYHYLIYNENRTKVKEKNYSDKPKISYIDNYNLFLISLSDEELNVLGNLLKMKVTKFKEYCYTYLQNQFVTSYLCYITGPVGVGKTTVKNLINCFCTINEWTSTELIPEALKKPPEALTRSEREKIDEWIANQVNLKNLKLRNLDPGIYVIDRCPLDAFAFTSLHEWQKKAKFLNTHLERKIIGGHIILLLGDPHVMAIRALKDGKTPTDESISLQQELLKKVYPSDEDGITVINTHRKTPSQIVKIIIKKIFFEKYNIFQLQEWLDNIELGVINPNAK